MNQPIDQDGILLCPECNSELVGDGENHLECMECDYQIHEVDIE